MTGDLSLVPGGQTPLTMIALIPGFNPVFPGVLLYIDMEFKTLFSLSYVPLLFH